MRPIDIGKALNFCSDDKFNEIIGSINLDSNTNFYQDFITRKSSRQTFVRELISFLQRHNRLDEIKNILERELQQPDSISVSEYLKEKGINIGSNSIEVEYQDDIEDLGLTITNVKQSLDTLRKNTYDKGLKEQLGSMQNELEGAALKTDKLQASVRLPEDMTIQLVKSDLLEHLDEYRSDENKAYLLIGIFAGTESGILVNWATEENFSITRPSLVLIILFALLLGMSVWWATQLHIRATKLKKKIFRSTKNVPNRN